MVDLNTNVLVIMLNIKELNATLKDKLSVVLFTSIIFKM